MILSIDVIAITAVLIEDTMAKEKLTAYVDLVQ